ncbi:DUF58 domain-containing protein [Photobacterium sanctipauli]|uniref:DUF58 domain-containing protein n=2 Tax=Photobacterium sanctipauli TaxID=1342794 RepID=A0A2T3N989_9GAMM|nr:DUF58 domain-containing protein [Photobacterium sanctipauli]PSW09991.1 DUF58 domain-containing protein [Photobacterium sanctipauli]
MVVNGKQPNRLDHRLYCDYANLVKLQAHADGFKLLPRLCAGSALVGRHHSAFRGRGLNFEELRHYQHGDDIRNLDWKVTLRTGKPHIRSYTEEKDRNVMICVDQRSSMFFSSVAVMKAVVAAEVAALTAWRVLKDSDRVGFVISTTDELVWSTPKRSQRDTLLQLSQLAQANQRLSAISRDSSEVGFDRLIALLNQLKCRNTTIIILSDWSGVTDDGIHHLKYLQKHNNVLGVLITDPLETSLLTESTNGTQGFVPWVVADGDYQLNLHRKPQVDKASAGLAHHYQLKKQQLLKLMTIQHLPMIELGTGGDHLAKFKGMVGGLV